MEEFVTLRMIDEAVQEVRNRIKSKPVIGLILGTGLGDLAESIQPAVIIPYSEIPHWPKSTIQGHKGRLVIGELEGKPVLVMQGRAHYYEGYSMSLIGFPIRVMTRLGIKTLIVTNSAGAINSEYEPGDVMLIHDHISLIAMGGLNPLRGPNLDEFGTRFPDMSQPYDRQLIQMADQVATEKKIKV